MKASLQSVRIAPKKANIIAKMVRGMPVLDAIAALKRTNKKAARLIEELLLSAVANARHNDRQDASILQIKTIVVNQGQAYRRGIPKARGQVRPIKKFMSHIDVTLGVIKDEDETPAKKKKAEKKTARASSQTKKNPVQKKPKSEGSSSESPASSETSKTSSASSAS